MASTQELKDVVKECLENRGILGQIKARIRAEVFNALDDNTEAKPPLNNENMIINELIREYLEFNKYKYTASVLVAESGQPKTPLDRRFLAKELNVEEDRNSSSVPLLYGIVSHFLRQNKLQYPNRPTSPYMSRNALYHETERGMGSSEGFHDGDPFVVMGGKR
ncbi:hypothetical protein CHS0354_033200 [Potamilus streckersoni]|uniref:Centrosomal protein 20 n=1 Tax=Potamilus streckersoni TaxID=2493646 RepID=A0AAE0S6F8_9BIVA|nr:hypothetical protein CHS0354_033200 [Potamilus streckersoni]